MRGDPSQVEPHRLDLSLVDLPRVAALRHIASRAGDSLEEVELQASSRDFLGELNHAAGVMEDLHRLDAGDVVEEPTAAREHQHGVALHLQELEGSNAYVEPPLRRLEPAESRLYVRFDELGHVVVGAIENDIDVGVARGPRITNQALGLVLVN